MAAARICTLALAVFCAFAPASPGRAQPDDLDAIFEARAALERLAWMSGTWEAEHQQLQGVAPTWTEEVWSSPRGAMMLGFIRRGQGQRLGSWEWVRIQGDEAGRLSLYTQADGENGPVVFALVRASEAEAVFENAAHDYPQRITYRREGNRLTIDLSRLDGSDARSRQYRLRSGTPRELPGR